MLEFISIARWLAEQKLTIFSAGGSLLPLCSRVHTDRIDAGDRGAIWLQRISSSNDLTRIISSDMLIRFRLGLHPTKLYHEFLDVKIVNTGYSPSEDIFIEDDTRIGPNTVFYIAYSLSDVLWCLPSTFSNKSIELLSLYAGFVTCKAKKIFGGASWAMLPRGTP